MDVIGQDEIDWQQAELALTSAFIREMPGIIEHWAKASGRPIPLSEKQIHVLGKQFARDLVAFLKPLVGKIAQEPDPQKQMDIVLEALESMIRSQYPEIPLQQSVFVFFASLAEELSAPLKGWANDTPWYYHTRHALYREFIADVIRIRGFDATHGFLVQAFEDLAPQFQSLITARSWLPKEFQRETKQFTTAKALRQFGTWQAIAGHWDKWSRIPYGLLRLHDGKPKSWEETGEVVLRDRIDQLDKHAKLKGLACKGLVSVRIRNALDHGSAIYNPQTRCAEFRDKGNPIIVPEAEIRAQAIDMALANHCMFMTAFLIMDTMLEGFRNGMS